MNRRGLNAGNTMTSQANIDDGSWKAVSEGGSMLPASNSAVLNPDGSNQSGFAQGGLPYNSAGNPYPPAGQSSPAGNQSIVFQNSNQPGSNTPQYTSSPAPSGSSTPGPVGAQNIPGNYPQSATAGNFNGPVGGPFGSPSSGPVQPAGQLGHSV
uniref:Short form of CHIP n=1 Tax=Drosophila melanogaster TaxID=7227 RepID=O18355_DROME|nr:short form of CHIP [Drosophila melanogaster]